MPPGHQLTASQIILTFSENVFSLDRTKVKLFVSGSTAVATNGDGVNGKVVTLSLVSAVLSNSPPLTVGLDADAVEDKFGNGNAAQSTTSITNRVQAVPLAPTALTATPAPDTTPQLAVDLSWTAPASRWRQRHHLAPVQVQGRKRLTRQLDHDFRQRGERGQMRPPSPSKDFRQAARQLNFTFEVQAVNTNGAGDESNQATATVDVPGQISGFTATEESGQVRLSWTPANNFGSRILRYQYSVHDNDAGTYVVSQDTNMPDSNANTTNFTVTGLTNGHSHTIAVRAVNSVGGGSSEILNNVVPATILTAPRNLAAEAGHQEVRLTWDRATVQRWAHHPELLVPDERGQRALWLLDADLRV